MPVSPSDLIRGRRYTVVVGDPDPGGPLHRSMYNVIYRGVMRRRGQAYVVFEAPYVIHLIEREALYEIEPWRLTL